jgi:hypothetical protein
VMLTICRLVTVKNCHFGYPRGKDDFPLPEPTTIIKRRGSPFPAVHSRTYAMEPRTVHTEFRLAAPLPSCAG